LKVLPTASSPRARKLKPFARRCPYHKDCGQSFFDLYAFFKRYGACKEGLIDRMNTGITGMHERELFGCRKLYVFANFYQRTRLNSFKRKTELNSRNDGIHDADIRYIYGYRAKTRHFYEPLHVKYERWHVIKRDSSAFAPSQCATTRARPDGRAVFDTTFKLCYPAYFVSREPSEIQKVGDRFSKRAGAEADSEVLARFSDLLRG
jgi:hypothetical protein